MIGVVGELSWAMRALSRAGAVLCALGLSACAYNDHFDNRAARFDIAAEQARDEMIFTNIIRASRAEPLAFQQLGQITGQNQSGGQLGLPSIVLGPTGGLSAATKALDGQYIFGSNPAITGFASNSINTSGSTSFGVTPSETKDFYRGLLLTVAPETLAFFSEQGVAPETLFYLFTEKVVEERNGRVQTFVNDPLNPSFEGFRHYVELATRYGLSAEPTPGARSTALPRSAKGANPASPEAIPNAEWRLCFDRSVWKADTPAAGNRPFCGSKEKLSSDRAVEFRDSVGALVKAQVYPRSTFAIFQYLGKIIAAGDEAKIKLVSPEAISRGSLRDENLFTVERGANAGGCFLWVNYAGGSYCIPQEGAANTKRVLGLLAQLLALSTSVRDIGFTPSVRVLQ